jgi:integrase
MAQRSGIWYRADRRVWCGRVNGRVVAFGPDEGEARRRWRAATGQGGGLTCDELVKRWLDWQEARVSAGRLAPESLAIYRQQSKPFAKWAGSRLAASVGGPDVLAWANGHAGWSIATRAIYGRLAGQVFRWAVGQGLLSRSPMAGLSPSTPQPRRRWVTPEDAAAVIAACRSEAMRDLLRFLWATGCRPGEAYRLTLAECDLDAGVAVMARHKCSRTGRARLIPLPPVALEIVRRQGERNQAGPVLRNCNGKPWQTNAVNQHLLALHRATGCPRIFPYQLRALWATDALAAGEAPAIVAECLGHSVRTLDRHYSGLSGRRELLRSVAARVRAG